MQNEAVIKKNLCLQRMSGCHLVTGWLVQSCLKHPLYMWEWPWKCQINKKYNLGKLRNNLEDRSTQNQFVDDQLLIKNQLWLPEPSSDEEGLLNEDITPVHFKSMSTADHWWHSGHLWDNAENVHQTQCTRDKNNQQQCDAIKLKSKLKAACRQNDDLLLLETICRWTFYIQVLAQGT